MACYVNGIFFDCIGEANGLCHTLTVACPKPRPTMWDLSPQTRDKWEIDRTELEFIRKLGSGNFGEVWYGKCTVDQSIGRAKCNLVDIRSFIDFFLLFL